MPAKKALAAINPSPLAIKVKNLVTIVSVDPVRLRQEVETFTEGSATLAMCIDMVQVCDEQTLEEAVRLRNEAGRREKGLTEIWKRYKQPLNAARTEVLALEKGTVEYFTGLKEAVNQKIVDHAAAQLRAKKEAEAAFQKAADADRRNTLRNAEELMSKGYVKQALALEQQAETIVTPILPDPEIKVAGNRFVPGYQGTCTDPMALIRAIAAGNFPLLHDVKGAMRPILIVDPVVINAIVSRHQDGTKIPGVEVTETLTASGVRF